MAKRVTDADIIKINTIYHSCGNKAETARQTGFSASTVSKYIIPDFVPVKDEFEQNEQNENAILFKYDFSQHKLPLELFQSKNWNHLLPLNNKEIAEMELFKKGLVM